MKKQLRVQTRVRAGYRGCEPLKNAGWLCSDDGKDEKMCWDSRCISEWGMHHYDQNSHK